MIRFKKCILIAFLLLSGNIVFAQYQGFGGKKFYIYVTPINGITSFLTSLNVEYLLYRNFSICGGINFYSQKIKQEYSPYLYPTFYDENYIMPDKAKVSTLGVNLEFRKYFNNILKLPSPNGLFVFAAFKYNNLDVEGNYYRDLTEYGSSSVYINYDYTGLGSYSIEAGIGKNRVLKDWLVAGVKLGISYNKILSSVNSTTDKILSPVGSSYGANIYGISLNNKYIPTDANLGISIYGEIGILLF